VITRFELLVVEPPLWSSSSCSSVWRLQLCNFVDSDECLWAIWCVGKF